MARKATDLLDVFRFSSEDDQQPKTGSKSASGRGSTSGKGKGRATSSVSKSGSRGSRRSQAALTDGIHLTSRQVLLASCAALLLLVLSFTLGLATGRPGTASEREPALNRQTLVMIRGSLPLVDPASRRQTDVGRIRRKLRSEYDVPDQYLRIWKEGGRLILQVGPFRDEEQARRFLTSKGLDMAEINMATPFFAPRFVAAPQ